MRPFSPRDEYSADYARYLSVRPSVIRRYSVEVANISPQFFSPSAKHTILVFPTKRYGMVILRRGPPNEGVECKGSMKNSDFPPIYRVMSETIQDRAVVTMKGK